MYIVLFCCWWRVKRFCEGGGVGWRGYEIIFNGWYGIVVVGGIIGIFLGNGWRIWVLFRLSRFDSNSRVVGGGNWLKKLDFILLLLYVYLVCVCLVIVWDVVVFGGGF